MKKIFCFISILIVCNISAQSTIVKVLDSVTLSPVPFATVYFSNNKGIIANENGHFELIKKELRNYDSLFISSMGYKKVSFDLNQFNDSIVFLSPKAIVLNNVLLSNRKLSSKEIIEKVKNAIDKNYQTQLSENKIFYRSEFSGITEKLELNKFKSSISEISSPLIDSLLNSLPKENKGISEILCYYYGNQAQGNQKINLIKSRETYNKEDEMLKSLNSKLEKSLQENLKSNSYFKIRSGLLPFSGDLEIDGLWDVEDSISQEAIKKAQDSELKRKQNFANSRKSRINNIYSKLFYNDGTDLDFILKSSRYKFSIPKLTYLGNQLVYIINCEPKGSKDFKGTLYINSEDFAVVRIDFKNVKPLFKLKLLGISVNNYLEEGRMVFSKLNNENYSLSYFQLSSARKLGVDRPFKIIEKNKYVKGRKKQNQISFKLDLVFKSIYSQELQVFESKVIDEKNFQKIKEENKVLPEFLDEFTTNFWEEF